MLWALLLLVAAVSAVPQKFIQPAYEPQGDLSSISDASDKSLRFYEDDAKIQRPGTFDPILPKYIKDVEESYRTVREANPRDTKPYRPRPQVPKPYVPRPGRPRAVREVADVQLSPTALPNLPTYTDDVNENHRTIREANPRDTKPYRPRPSIPRPYVPRSGRPRVVRQVPDIATASVSDDDLRKVTIEDMIPVYSHRITREANPRDTKPYRPRPSIPRPYVPRPGRPRTVRQVSDLMATVSDDNIRENPIEVLDIGSSHHRNVREANPRDTKPYRPRPQIPRPYNPRPGRPRTVRQVSDILIAPEYDNDMEEISLEDMAPLFSHRYVREANPRDTKPYRPRPQIPRPHNPRPGKPRAVHQGAL